MKELKDMIGKMRAMCDEAEKHLTMYEGEKVEKNQDGNRGNTINGEESYSDAGDFDNLSKKQILAQKMMAGMKG